ncbi:hypothetical protein JW979_15765 [bacterium]|nr:hypothetical protein [candidate division CSSED10-310 bacterium]
MKAWVYYSGLAVFTIFYIQLAFSAGQQSTHYQVIEDVISQGGEVSSGGVYTTDSTIGQTGTIGVQSQVGYENQSGFWHTVLMIPPVPALSVMALLILYAIFGILVYRKRESRRVVQ